MARGGGFAAWRAIAVAASCLLLAACGGSSGEEPNRPGKSPKGQATLWAVGDGDASPAGQSVVQMITREKPDRFLYLGDVYDEGTADEFERNFEPSFGQLADVGAPTPGNHDWANRDEGYRAYWENARGRPTPDYYKFSLAGWEIISLNSEAPRDPDSGQVDWLRRQLDTPGNCRIAFWHAPRYSAGTNHGDDPSVASLWNALRDRAVLVLGAHDHNMQRFKPRDGITELISGAGGHGLYTVDERDPRLAWSDDERYGALKLELEPGLASFTFKSVDGKTLDSGKIGCRSAK